MNIAVGVDIGGTNIRVGLVDEKGHLIDSVAFKTRPERGTDAILEELAVQIGALIRDTDVHRITAIGVG